MLLFSHHNIFAQCMHIIFYIYRMHLHKPLITANLHRLFRRGLRNESYF